MRLGIIAGAPQAIESSIKKLWRLDYGMGSRSESVQITPRLAAYLGSAELRRLGYVSEIKPVEPEKETAIEYIKRCEQLAGGRIKALLSEVIATEARAHLMRQPHAGGWDLCEALGGKCLDNNRNLLLPGFEARVLDEHGLLVTVIRSKGRTYRYPVLAEFWKRHHPSKTIPSNCVTIGIPYGKSRQPSGRRGRRSRVRSVVTVLPGQGILL